MKIVCIDNGCNKIAYNNEYVADKRLTIGKVYDVLSINYYNILGKRVGWETESYSYIIVNDLGVKDIYLQETYANNDIKFITLEEYRNNKLNEILK